MSLPIPKYLAPVTIASGTNALYINDGTEWHTVAITAGTYYFANDDTATDLLDVIEDLLNTASTGHCVWTVDLDATNKVRFCGNTSTSSAWQVDFSSGYTTFDEDIVGHTAANLTAADNVAASCTNPHLYGWYPTQPIAKDSRPLFEADVTQDLTEAAQAYTTEWGTAELGTRDLVHHAEAEAYFLPVTGYTNYDWKTAFWPYARAGQRIRYYADRTLTTYYDCVLDARSCRWTDKPQKMFDGVDAWIMPVYLRTYVGAA